MPRIAQRRRFRVDLVLSLPDVGALQHADALCIGGHNAVFDAVVDHLYEVTGAVRTTVQISLFRSSTEIFSAGRARDVAHPWRERGEDGIEVMYDFVFTSDHHAVTAVETPNATAGSHIYVMDVLRCKVLRPPNVVDVVRIPSVNEDIAWFKHG